MTNLSAFSNRILRKIFDSEFESYKTYLPWDRKSRAEVTFSRQSKTSTVVNLFFTLQSDPNSIFHLFFYLNHEENLENAALKEYSTAHDYTNQQGQRKRFWNRSSEKWPTGGDEPHSEHAHPSVSYGTVRGTEIRKEGVDILNQILNGIDRDILSNRER